MNTGLTLESAAAAKLNFSSNFWPLKYPAETDGVIKKAAEKGITASVYALGVAASSLDVAGGAIGLKIFPGVPNTN